MTVFATAEARPTVTCVGGEEGRLLTDHPGWRPTAGGHVRAFRNASSTTVVISRAGEWFEPESDHAVGITSDVFRLPASVVPAGDALASALSELGPVTRFRNSDLWDALGTGVLRQVIRAAQSKVMYRTFCDRFGTPVEHQNVVLSNVFPSAETVLTLSDEQFTSAGMGFKMKPLRSAARAYLAERHSWESASPEALVDMLCQVPGIGPWTARASVADYTNDWSLYPVGDLAVRTWAKRADPKRAWPSSEVDFEEHWRHLAGPWLSDYTLLVLAWGSLRGDIG